MQSCSCCIDICRRSGPRPALQTPAPKRCNQSTSRILPRPPPSNTPPARQPTTSHTRKLSQASNLIIRLDRASDTSIVQTRRSPRDEISADEHLRSAAGADPTAVSLEEPRGPGLVGERRIGDDVVVGAELLPDRSIPARHAHRALPGRNHGRCPLAAPPRVGRPENRAPPRDGPARPQPRAALRPNHLRPRRLLLRRLPARAPHALRNRI